SSIDDLSQQTGLAVEATQALGFAADQSGADIALLGTGLRALVRRAAEAAQGNTTFARSFARIGVQVTDAEGRMRDTEDLLLAVADAVANMDSEAEASAALMNVMGDAGRRLVPFM